nr:hypothetical protein [uncultured Devosia sp.]
MNARTRSLVALTVIPVGLVGGLLWWLTGLVPECSNVLVSRLDSPDASKSMVVFTRDCGANGLNTQAVIMPAGGTLEGDATGFLALEGQHAPEARWDAYGNLEVTLPEGAVVVQRQDEAAGTSIIYN